MNVHQQVLRGKIQSFPIVCLTLTTSHSYITCNFVTYWSLQSSLNTNSDVEFLLQLTFGLSPIFLCPSHGGEAILTRSVQKQSSVLILPGLESPFTHHQPRCAALSTASLHTLLTQGFFSLNGSLLVPFFFFILYLTWKHKLISHLYAGDVTPLR